MVTNMDGHPWNGSSTDDTPQYAAIIRVSVDGLLHRSYLSASLIHGLVHSDPGGRNWDRGSGKQKSDI